MKKHDSKPDAEPEILQFVSCRHCIFHQSIVGPSTPEQPQTAPNNLSNGNSLPPFLLDPPFPKNDPSLLIQAILLDEVFHHLPCWTPSTTTPSMAPATLRRWGATSMAVAAVAAVAAMAPAPATRRRGLPGRDSQTRFSRADARQQHGGWVSGVAQVALHNLLLHLGTILKVEVKNHLIRGLWCLWIVHCHVLLPAGTGCPGHNLPDNGKDPSL